MYVGIQKSFQLNKTNQSTKQSTIHFDNNEDDGNKQLQCVWYLIGPTIIVIQFAPFNAYRWYVYSMEKSACEFNLMLVNDFK